MRTFTLAMSLAMAGAGFSSAHALEGCTCGAMTTPSAQFLGEVVSASGDVMIGGAKVAAGAKLLKGSEIVTGLRSAATIAVGGCNLELGSGYSAALSVTGPDVCVKV